MHRPVTIVETFQQKTFFHIKTEKLANSQKRTQKIWFMTKLLKYSLIRETLLNLCKKDTKNIFSVFAVFSKRNFSLIVFCSL